MRTKAGRVVVLVRPGRDRRRFANVVRWARALLPAAVLLVASPGPAAADDLADDVIPIDSDEVVSGPLSLAAEIARVSMRRRGA